MSSPWWCCSAPSAETVSTSAAGAQPASSPAQIQRSNRQSPGSNPAEPRPGSPGAESPHLLPTATDSLGDRPATNSPPLLRQPPTVCCPTPDREAWLPIPGTSPVVFGTHCCSATLTRQRRTHPTALCASGDLLSWPPIRSVALRHSPELKVATQQPPKPPSQAKQTPAAVSPGGENTVQNQPIPSQHFPFIPF